MNVSKDHTVIEIIFYLREIGVAGIKMTTTKDRNKHGMIESRTNVKCTVVIYGNIVNIIPLTRETAMSQCFQIIIETDFNKKEMKNLLHIINKANLTQV